MAARNATLAQVLREVEQGVVILNNLQKRLTEEADLAGGMRSVRACQRHVENISSFGHRLPQCGPGDCERAGGVFCLSSKQPSLRRVRGTLGLVNGWVYEQQRQDTS